MCIYVSVKLQRPSERVIPPYLCRAWARCLLAGYGGRGSFAAAQYTADCSCSTVSPSGRHECRYGMCGSACTGIPIRGGADLDLRSRPASVARAARGPGGPGSFIAAKPNVSSERVEVHYSCNSYASSL